MSEENKNLIETVEFRAIAPKGDLRGLDEPLKKLQALDAALRTVQNRLAGVSTGSAFKLSAAQFTSQVPSSGAQSVSKLAKLWGLPDVKDVEAYARQMETVLQDKIGKLQRKLDRTPVSPRGSTKARDAIREQIREMKAQSYFVDASAREFVNPKRAGQFAEQYGKAVLAGRATAEADSRKLMAALLGGSVPVSAMAAGPVPSMPSPMRATKAGAETVVADKAGKTAGSKFQDAMEKIKLELERNLNTADLEKIAGARSRAAKQIQALVGGSGDVKERTRDNALKFAATQERKSEETRQKVLSEAGGNVFQLRKKLAAAEKAGQREKARQLKAEIEVEEARIAGMKQLDKVFFKPLEKSRAAQATRNQQLSEFDVRRQAGLSRVRNVGQAWQDFLQNGGRMTHDEVVMDKKGSRRELRGEMKVGNTTRVFSASIGEADAKLRSYSKTVEEARQKTGWLGSDFLTNTAKIAKWSLSVGILYKTLGLAEHSFQTFLSASGQIARLEQIFRQVGGTTLELTSDILHLAAVTGQSGEAAMESAISWSRLGLNRLQVNEAVRLSLVAANVTQLTAAETTEHLQAITQNYGLTLGQLASKLGELNQISNVYNVTNADLLQGVSRSAALAKQAGMSFEELLGLIGATVGATKQTGANIGNAIKTIITSLGSPQLQEKLRLLYGIQSEKSGGHARTVTDVLDQIYVRYQKLGTMQQKAMTFSISGKFQSQRLSAMLDNYVRAQVLAIDAQLHLNTAEQENLKIVGSLKAQLSGLSAEWERFIVIQGNNGPAQALGQIASALRNVLGLLDSKAGSLLTTFMLGIGTAAMAKTGLAMMTTKSATKAGFIGGTQEQLLMAALALNGFTNTAINGTAAKMSARGLGMAGAPPWYLGGNTKVGNALGYGLGMANIHGANALTGMNKFGNAKLSAASKALQEMRLASAAANAAIGATVKSLALASAALIEFAIPIALVVGGIYLFNKAMDAMEGHAEASRKRLAGMNEEMERSAAAAGAMGQASKLFQTAIAAMSPMQGFGSVSKKNAFRMFDQMQDAIGLNEPDLDKRRAFQNAMVRRWKSSFVEGGDNKGIVGDMQQQQQIYAQAQRESLRENRQQRRRAQEELAGQQQKLETMNQNPTLWDRVAGGVQKRREQIEDIKGKQAELSGQIVQSLQDEIALTDEMLSTDQQVTRELAKQKGVLEAIASVFGSIQTTNPFEKWSVDLTAAEAHLMALNKQMDELRLSEKSNAGEQVMLDQKKTDAQAQLEIADKQLENLKAAQKMADEQIGKGASAPVAYAEASKKFGLGFSFADSNNGAETFSGRINAAKGDSDKWLDRINNLNEKIDPDNPGQVTNEMRMNKLQAEKRQQIFEAQNEVERVQAQQRIARQAALFQFGQERATRNATGQDYGVSGGDRIIRQREYLTRDIASLEQQIAEAERRGVDAMSLRGQLAQDIYLRQKETLDLLNRQQEVERDIYQLKMDQNKEFMKSFMGAGPAEMLQKLAAFRMAFDKNGQRKPSLSQGAFFAMSPGMRENYGQLNPNYNPQMMFLKQEQKQITDAIIKAFGSLKPEAVDKGLLNNSEALRKALGGVKDALSDTLTEIANNVRTAGTDLVSALSNLSESVKAVQENMIPGGLKFQLPVSAQSGGLGGGRGFTK